MSVLPTAFPDLPNTSEFFTEVSWLVDRGVTSGYADGGFHPIASVSRQAMAAFLYRYAGQDPFTPPATSPFTDVSTDSPFYVEICWLADQGITGGYADGGFHPTAAVSRQAMASFLYRFAGSPGLSVPETSPFPDLSAESPFYTAVSWLADVGVTGGYADGGFHPTAPVSRQAMAAFVYRYDTSSEIGREPVAPGPVTDVVVHARTTTGVTLGWANPRADGFAGVTVRRVDGVTPPDSPGAGTLAVETSGRVNEWADAGLAPGATYSYALFARYDDGTLVPAAPITVSVPEVASVTGAATGPGGVPVSGVTVEITDAGGTVVTASTGSNGRYEVAGLDAGDHTVCFITAGEAGGSATGYLPQCFDQVSAGETPTPVAVVAGTTTTVDVVLAAGGSVSGRVSAPDGTPLAGVVVDVEHPGGQPIAFAVTDDAGAWAVTGLNTGVYGVCFDPSNLATGFGVLCYDAVLPISVPNPVTVTAGTTTTGIDATLQPEAPQPAHVLAASPDPAAAGPASSGDVEPTALITDAVPAAASTLLTSTDLASTRCEDVLFLGARGSGQTGPGGAKTNPDDSFAGLGGEVYTAYAQLRTTIGDAFTITSPVALAYAADAVPPETWITTYVHDLWQGVKATRDALTARAAQCPNERVVLAGYSQGAMIMHRVLTNATTTDVPSMSEAILARVDATILIADGDRIPHDTTRNYGTAVGTAQGIGTQADVTVNTPTLTASIGARTFSVCEELDVVCDFRVAYALPSLLPDSYGQWVHSNRYNQSDVVRRAATDAAAAIRPMSTGPRPETTIRVSAALFGAPANGESYESSISADGRWIAYSSDASNLVSVDTNHLTDVFVTDRLSGETILVSKGVGGSAADGQSLAPCISDDGRWIAYGSTATNLVTGDTNGFSDTFVWDRTTRTTTLVSAAPNGAPADDWSSLAPRISADGRWIVYGSPATNLVDGDTNGAWDVFLWDRASGGTTLVTARPDGSQSNEHSYYPAISGDGRWVTYYSYASNLVSQTPAGVAVVLVWDRTTRETTLVTAGLGGAGANASSYAPEISSDGRWITYYSAASNLVAVDTNNIANVFLWDRTTQDTTLVSTGPNGIAGGGYPTISGDGRWVTYESGASNLVGGDTNGTADVYVWDRATGQTTLISARPDHTSANDYSLWPSISADGRWISYNSVASDLVTGDTTFTLDVFVADNPLADP